MNTTAMLNKYYISGIIKKNVFTDNVLMPNQYG